MDSDVIPRYCRARPLVGGLTATSLIPFTAKLPSPTFSPANLSISISFLSFLPSFVQVLLFLSPPLFFVLERINANARKSRRLLNERGRISPFHSFCDIIGENIYFSTRKMINKTSASQCPLQFLFRKWKVIDHVEKFFRKERRNISEKPIFPITEGEKIKPWNNGRGQRTTFLKRSLKYSYQRYSHILFREA